MRRLAVRHRAGGADARAGRRATLPRWRGPCRSGAPPTPPAPLPAPQKMVFFQKAGAMNSDVPILGQDFNTWFPLTMVVYVALLSLNWWERCCSKIFIANRFRFEAVSGRGSRHGAGLQAWHLSRVGFSECAGRCLVATSEHAADKRAAGRHACTHAAARSTAPSRGQGRWDGRAAC